MFIILFVIAVIIAILISFIGDEFLTAIGFCIPIGVVIGCLICIGIVVNGRTYDTKIKMYTEENKAIEKQIETVVTNYMEFESETMKDLKGESAVTMVSLYPELKSDELVKEQIKTYQSNNAKIKELKESKINVSNAKWWLYFGK